MPYRTRVTRRTPLDRAVRALVYGGCILSIGAPPEVLKTFQGGLAREACLLSLDSRGRAVWGPKKVFGFADDI